MADIDNPVAAQTDLLSGTTQDSTVGANPETGDSPDEEYGYGDRTCMECGKTFRALHFAQICCSEECRKLRRKNKNRASVARHMSKLHSKIERLEKELAIANGMIDALKLELAGQKTVASAE